MSRAALLLAFLASLAFAEDQEVLLGVLSKWKACWNEGSAEKTIAMFHPDSKMAKRIAKDGGKQSYIDNTQNLIDQLGKIEEISLGKFVENGKVYVMKVKYEKKGLIPGTFSVAKDSKGDWLFRAFYITGQGEPELKE